MTQRDGDLRRERSGDGAIEFEQAAGKQRVPFLAELWSFMRHNKKWWLTPIILTLVLLGALVALGGSAAAPFLYPLF